MNRSIFREYDIRGVVERDLPASDVTLLGRAIAGRLLESGETEVVVGHDARLTSPSLRDALVEGLVGSGLEVTDVGQVPTPVLYYSLKALGKEKRVKIKTENIFQKVLQIYSCEFIIPQAKSRPKI